MKQNDEIEKKLLESGFTENEIKKLKHSLTYSNKNKYPDLASIIPEMKKRFITGCVLILMILAVYPFSLHAYTKAEILSAIFVTVLSLFAVYFVTPLKLAFKCYLYLRKESKNKK